MTEVGGIAGGRLKAFIERIERLEEEKRALAEDVKEVFAEAKGVGFDVKVMRQVLKIRKMDQAEREEQEELLDPYLRAMRPAAPKEEQKPRETPDGLWLVSMQTEFRRDLSGMPALLDGKRHLLRVPMGEILAMRKSSPESGIPTAYAVRKMGIGIAVEFWPAPDREYGLAPGLEPPCAEGTLSALDCAIVLASDDATRGRLRP